MGRQELRQIIGWSIVPVVTMGLTGLNFYISSIFTESCSYRVDYYFIVQVFMIGFAVEVFFLYIFKIYPHGFNPDRTSDWIFVFSVPGLLIYPAASGLVLMVLVQKYCGTDLVAKGPLIYYWCMTGLLLIVAIPNICLTVLLTTQSDGLKAARYRNLTAKYNQKCLSVACDLSADSNRRTAIEMLAKRSEHDRFSQMKYFTQLEIRIIRYCSSRICHTNAMSQQRCAICNGRIELRGEYFVPFCCGELDQIRHWSCIGKALQTMSATTGLHCTLCATNVNRSAIVQILRKSLTGTNPKGTPLKEAPKKPEPEEPQHSAMLEEEGADLSHGCEED